MPQKKHLSSADIFKVHTRRQLDMQTAKSNGQPFQKQSRPLIKCKKPIRPQLDSPFPSLPGELRNEIYALVFGFGGNAEDAPVQFLDPTPPTKELVMTCQAAREEA